MKSKAHLKSHPLHPILVSFPIAFFTGTWLLDIIGYLTGRGDFHEVAKYLLIGGLGFALLAAVPGIIDYFLVIPPRSSAKKRGTKHGLLNLTMVAIFAIALVIRLNQEFSLIIPGLETAGVILMTIAGWMGGTLVYRNQIGVDIRYANAGKWNEEHISQDKGEIVVARVDELGINQMKLVHVDGKRIVIGRSENGFVAFDDHCTHRGGSLAGGSMICGMVQCPWHGSQFDVSTGRVGAGPAKENIAVYQLKQVGENVILVI